MFYADYGYCSPLLVPVWSKTVICHLVYHASLLTSLPPSRLAPHSVFSTSHQSLVKSQSQLMSPLYLQQQSLLVSLLVGAVSIQGPAGPGELPTTSLIGFLAVSGAHSTCALRGSAASTRVFRARTFACIRFLL